MRKLVLLMNVFLFTGCYYHTAVLPKVDSDGSYLPLEVGNTWDFQTIFGSTYSRVHREVIGTATINNHQYYLLVTSYNYSPSLDSAYYRIDNSGFVYIHRKDQPTFEDNRLRLFAQNGDTWTYPVDNNSTAQITATLAPLQLGSVEIQNCKGYYFDVPNWADEENTIMLAPGIGFVKEYSNAWGIGQILKSAKIHGQVHNF